MEILNLEFIKAAGEIEKAFPEEFKMAYPRRILTPQNYGNPRVYAATLAAVLSLRNTNYNARNHVVAGIDICAQRLVEQRVPTFFIHPEFLRAIAATDLSPDFEFQNLKWPFDAMLFCLPLDVMKEIFPVPVPWLSIARIPQGSHNIGQSFKINFDQDRVAFHAPVFSDSLVPCDFGGQWPSKGSLQEYINSKPFLDDSYQKASREDRGLGNLTPEVDAEVSRKITTLATMIVLGMIARPEYVEMGVEVRKAKIVPNRPEKSYDALWSPNVVGEKYARKYESERTGDGSGAPRRFFKRRGHMRNQIYGKMFTATGEKIPAQDRPHEVRWIDPIGE